MDKKISFDLEEYDVKLMITSDYRLPDYKVNEGEDEKKWPFPIAVMYFIPKMKHEKRPIPPKLEALTVGADIEPTMTDFKYEVIDRLEYAYKVHDADMLDCIYFNPRKRKLCIKRSWLFDAFYKGIVEDMDINPFIAFGKIKDTKIDTFYSLA